MAIVTSYGYHIVMKEARVAELKARLSEFIRAVRRGDTVTIFDRNTPVARLVPIANGGLRIREPREGSLPPNKVPIPSRKKLKFDVLELLLEERQNQR
jgi:prevent-host-death family protein